MTMSTKLRTLFTLAVPVAAAGLAAAWVLGLISGPRQQKFTYETAAVDRGTVARSVSTSGPVRALVTVSVGSQLSGQIEELNVDFNSEVKSGDVLAKLDAKTYRAKVAQANADLAAAKAQLANQQAALAKAHSVLKVAKLSVERQQALATKGVSAQSALDNAVRDQEVAAADIEVAGAQIESAKATITQREAALNQAQIDLDRTVISSPINGTVISRTIDKGQTVAASLQAPELFKIAQDLRRIMIEAQVNEADIGSVAEGNPVSFTVDAYPDRRFVGTVTQVRLSSTELQNVVTYTVIIEAKNEDRKLFPGMTANVQIETAKRDNALRVPNEALRFKPKDVVETADQKEERDAPPGERTGRMVDRISDQLALTEQQVELLRAEMKKLGEERRQQREQRSREEDSAPKGPASFMPGPPRGGNSEEATAARGRMIARVQQILGPTMSDEQRAKFEAWKRGREAMKRGTVWVMGADGQLESKRVVTGVADDHFTEIVSGQLKEDQRVALRARAVQQ